MLRLRGQPQRLCDGMGRRDFLHLGALGTLGLELPALLRASADRSSTRSRTFGKAKRCLTPLINKFAGRDHWSAVQSVVFAGAGIGSGSVFGASDRDGANPAEKPVAPADITATLMHLLGIPDDLEIVDRMGRPLRACQGQPITGILT